MKQEVIDTGFEDLRNAILDIDPVSWSERHLFLEGQPLRLHGSGFKPFADIYRYIGIKALEPNSKPVVMVKGRQVGGTVMACALSMYFVGSGLFGTNGKPPIRVLHVFPQNEQASKYSKEKLSQIIATSVPMIGDASRGKGISFLESLLDKSNDGNNSQGFKLFKNGNFLRIDATGLDGKRLRGGTTDVILLDECFPYNQYIEINGGKKRIGKIYEDFINNKIDYFVKTFNEEKKIFEYKRILNAWKRDKRELLYLQFGKRKIKCTPDHKFLTNLGYVMAKDLNYNHLIITDNGTKRAMLALNDDQKQIILGSFLGDGNLSEYSPNRYRVRILHSIKQKAYCTWKAKMFNSSINFIEENGKYKKKAVQFNSSGFVIENSFPKGKKNTCPKWILDKLDPRGIAIWFMDDGSISRNKYGELNSGKLHTCSFDYNTHLLFVDFFKKFSIDCKIIQNDKYYRLSFDKKNINILSKLIAPYIHNNILYKIDNRDVNIKYDWNDKFLSFGYEILTKKQYLEKKEYVYDIEVEDNHNFIITNCSRNNNLGGLVVSNCQNIRGEAIGNTIEMLKQANYGHQPGGVQVYFGTPLRKGSDYYKMWQRSSQQYYYLGCENCKEYFPLYTPESNEWEKIWIREFIVKCPHCQHEQNKLEAADRGKWVATKDPNDPDVLFIGFHINQFYMPKISREFIESEKPGIHPTNTERKFQNEICGEFYQGDSSPITFEELIEVCGERERKFRARINPGEEQMVLMGIDYGLKSSLETLADPDRKSQGKSFTSAVIMSVKGPNLFSIDRALTFDRNDPEYKKGLIDQLMRQYSVDLCVGDIGFSQDFSHTMHTIYGDKYLVSRALNKVNDKIKFSADIFPKEIGFERDYYIGEIFDLFKKGQFKFPLGDYDKISWLIEHCVSLELKPKISRNGGDPEIHYVKGGSSADGLFALMNAYLAYKYLITGGFSIKNPHLMKTPDKQNKLPIVFSNVSRRF